MRVRQLWKHPTTLTFLAGLSAVLLYHVTQTGALLILVQLLLTFGIITLLETAGRRNDG